VTNKESVYRWRLANRDAFLASRRRWREKNREKINAAKRAAHKPRRIFGEGAELIDKDPPMSAYELRATGLRMDDFWEIK
jgi:predicted HTH domain antitoxin